MIVSQTNPELNDPRVWQLPDSFLYVIKARFSLRFNNSLGGTKVAYIKGWRDDITGFCKDNSPEFVEATKLCPPEVFRYLPNNILDLMIHIYDKYNDAERKEAAKKALEKESNHE